MLTQFKIYLTVGFYNKFTARPCYISHRTSSVPLHYLAKLLRRTRSTFSKLLMMIVGVSKFGKTNLIFVDPGIKTSGTYYRYVLLTEQLLPVMSEISGEFFVFQHNSAHVHRACETINFLNGRHQRSLHQICAPNSPELSPVDYKICGEMQQRVYRTKVLRWFEAVFDLCMTRLGIKHR